MEGQEGFYLAERTPRVELRRSREKTVVSARLPPGGWGWSSSDPRLWTAVWISVLDLHLPGTVTQIT